MDPSSSTIELGLRMGWLRFRPKEHELVDYFLRNRISLGDKFQSPFVSDCPEFNGRIEPWVLWQMYGSGGGESEDDKTLYFFTHRRRLSPTSTRYDRKVGSGTWSGQHPNNVFDLKDKTVVIGIRREFRYEQRGRDSRHNGAWLMQEYQLVDDDSDIVLCTLRKNPRTERPSHSSSVVNPRTERPSHSSSVVVVENNGVNEKKRKSTVDPKPKKKKQKKLRSVDHERR